MPGGVGPGGIGTPPVYKKYNPSSFFDEISCDALDRLNGNGGNGFNMSEER